MSDYNSDVSLDEEDEELIGRVFYESVHPELENDELRISDDDESLSDISDSELEAIGDPELAEKYKKLKARKPDKTLGEEERKRLMMSNFSEDQMDRFEAYRRTTINKPGVKKVCNAVLGHSIPQNLSVILAGLSKLFLSEIITKAFEVQEREYKAKLIMDIDAKKIQKKEILKNMENGDDVVEVQNIKLSYNGDFKAPLKPEHIREAMRLYSLEYSGAFRAHWKGQVDPDGALFR